MYTKLRPREFSIWINDGLCAIEEHRVIANGPLPPIEERLYPGQMMSTCVTLIGNDGKCLRMDVVGGKGLSVPMCNPDGSINEERLKEIAFNLYDNGRVDISAEGVIR